MSLDALVQSPALEALAFALLHFVWQGAAVAALYAVFLPALARQSAEARHRAACVALACMAAAPVVTFFLLLPAHAPPATAAALPAVSAKPADVLRVVLLATWAGGVLFFSVRLSGGLLFLRRLARLDTAPLADRWIDAARRLAGKMGASPRIALLSSPHVSVPMAFGWLKPVVLIPLTALTAMPPGYVEALLAHEIAHLRRRDFLVSLLESVVEAVLFYHPAVWWISARIREEREFACDDLATAILDDRLVYAHALTSLEELRRSRPALALPATGGPLVRRIRRLLAPAPVPSRLRAWTAPLVLATALVPLAAAAVGAAMAPPASPAGRASDIGIVWMPPVLEPWRDEIATAAATHGVDPELLAILVLVESAGNPDARSTSGAVGLLQVMPATAAHIAEARGQAGFAPAQLRDPVYNLDAGAWYLARQLEEFGAGRETDAAVELAAAAYNGGPRQVKASLAGSGALSEETLRYRALVAALWKERRSGKSPAFDAWRARALSRLEGRTVDPLPGARVTLLFQALTPDFGSGTRVHEGLDLAAPSGTEVHAPLPGVVRIATADGGDAGTIVVVDHGKGLETRYHHLGELRVRAGQKVAAGAVLGTVGTTGTTGKTTGPHVHVEARDVGRLLDPMLLLPSP